MSAFSWILRSEVEKNINLMFARLKKISTKPIKHEDFLSLFVPAEHRQLFRDAARLTNTGTMRRAAFKWNGLALTFQLNAPNSSVPPPIPRFMALQPDAPEDLVESITDWSRNGGDASGDFGRVLQLFRKLNDTLSKAQMRFVWPSIIAICNANHDNINMMGLAGELQMLRASAGVALPRGLLLACRKTAATISMTSLIPHDVEARAAGEVTIEASDGGTYEEPELGTFEGLS